jgi:hypothetical protein
MILTAAVTVLERQGDDLDVAHERARVFIRKFIDLNHVWLQDEAARAFGTRVTVRCEARPSQIGNRPFRGRTGLGSLIADGTTFSLQILLPLG